MNAANESLEGGGGVDFAVHCAVCPPALARWSDNCHNKVPYSIVTAEGDAVDVGDWCTYPVGQVVQMLAFCLPSGSQVHSPYQPQHPCLIRLELPISCSYACANCLGDAKDDESIRFCCMGTGFYGFPRVLAAMTALRTTLNWLLDSMT